MEQELLRDRAELLFAECRALSDDCERFLQDVQAGRGSDEALQIDLKIVLDKYGTYVAVPTRRERKKRHRAKR